SHWLYEKYQNKNLGTQPLVNLSALNAVYSSLHATKKIIYKKKIYAETIEIAHKAINIAIKIDDPDMLRFLKKYITQKEYSLVENTTSIYILKEQSKSNIPEILSVRLFVKNTTSINILKENSKSNISETLSIRYAKNGKKVHDTLIICQFCGGSRYKKKELHNYDFVKINDENKWVES
ncbi:21710_t:CDS:2, partial [Racocetra persica]